MNGHFENLVPSNEIRKMQHSRDTFQSFGSRDNPTNFSRNILYNLANEVFGFDGWSTTILIVI